MKTKSTLFGAGALVIAGALMGIYPPASQGAIGQRDVYRVPQSHDAAVTPGSAPVAAGTLTPAQNRQIQDGVRDSVRDNADKGTMVRDGFGTGSGAGKCIRPSVSSGS